MYGESKRHPKGILKDISMGKQRGIHVESISSLSESMWGRHGSMSKCHGTIWHPNAIHMRSIWNTPRALHINPCAGTWDSSIRFRSNTFAFALVQYLIEGRTRDGIPGSPLLLGLERAKANRVSEPPCLGTRVLNINKFMGHCLLTSKSECVPVGAKANVALGLKCTSHAILNFAK